MTEGSSDVVEVVVTSLSLERAVIVSSLHCVQHIGSFHRVLHNKICVILTLSNGYIEVRMLLRGWFLLDTVVVF